MARTPNYQWVNLTAYAGEFIQQHHPYIWTLLRKRGRSNVLLTQADDEGFSVGICEQRNVYREIRFCCPSKFRDVFIFNPSAARSPKVVELILASYKKWLEKTGLQHPFQTFHEQEEPNGQEESQSQAVKEIGKEARS